MNKQTFFQGTLILAIAGLITRILGFIYRIILSRMIGDEGMGLYQMAFPVLIVFITLATAGLPVAISKLVAEAEALGDNMKIRSVLRTAFFLSAIVSLVFTAGVIYLAPIMSQRLLTDSRTYYTLLAIAPAIPVIAISALLRGLFQGRQNMIPSAQSQITETLVRIVAVLILAYLSLPFGVEFAAAGAMCGVFIGELGGMGMLLFHFRRSRGSRRKQKPVSPFTPLSGKRVRHWGKTLRELLSIAVPVTTSRLVGSVAYMLEPIVVSHSLAIAGIATTAATSLYGQFSGMAFPLIAFPTLLTLSLSTSLVPAVSEAAAGGSMRLVHRRLNQAMRISLIFGAPCAVVLYVLGEPISQILYRIPEVGDILRVMAPFALFYYLQGPLAAALQGLDMAGRSMFNSIAGAIMKILTILLLASQPFWGIKGVAMGVNVSIVVVTLLHLHTLGRKIGYHLDIKNLTKVVGAALVMGMVCEALSRMLEGQYPLLIATLLAITGGLMAYLLFLLATNGLKKSDFKRALSGGKKRKK